MRVKITKPVEGHRVGEFVDMTDEEGTKLVYARKALYAYSEVAFAMACTYGSTTSFDYMVIEPPKPMPKPNKVTT